MASNDNNSTSTVGSKKDKMQEDFSHQVAEAIPRGMSKAKEGKLSEAIDYLLALEKQTRLAEDNLSTSKLAVAIVKMCWELKDYVQLNQILHILAKRRGQLRVVIQDFVREAMSYLDHIQDKERKLELIDTLRTITEGKMFVEIERARLTRILARIKEAEGNISEAADILQEIQVETFGQMDKHEKTEFILEQMRLCLDKKDFIKAQILSNKIMKRSLNAEDMQQQKVDYYALMVRYYAHSLNFLEMARAFYQIYETPSISSNSQLANYYLGLVIVYISLSPYDNEQVDFMNRIYKEKSKLEPLPMHKSMLQQLLAKELIQWHGFSATYLTIFSPALPQMDPKHPHQILAEYIPHLKKRVVEHNIRVVSEYYSRISMKRLSQLLELQPDEVEENISELVVKKSIWGRIDRPKGIVSFRKHKEANEMLNEWSSNVTDLLGLLEKTTHLIHRELMVHKIDQ